MQIMQTIAALVPDYHPKTPITEKNYRSKIANIADVITGSIFTVAILKIEIVCGHRFLTQQQEMARFRKSGGQCPTIC